MPRASAGILANGDPLSTKSLSYARKNSLQFHSELVSSLMNSSIL
jgi:hypothetical protein